MSRPRKDPTLRFQDVVPIFNKAMDNDGIKLPLPTISKAVHIVHRLNLYRKYLREMGDEPFIKADGFIFRARENVVEIERRPVIDLSGATTIDGKPLREPEHIPSPLDEIAAKYDENWDGLMTEDMWFAANRALRDQGQPELPRSRIRPKSGSFIE